MENHSRLSFFPRDRILFLHLGCNRVFEGVVTRVDMRFTHVSVSIPNHVKALKIGLKLDVNRAFQDYELISMFRPAAFQVDAPPGFYLNHAATDLWLELDDLIEIIQQGAKEFQPSSGTSSSNRDVFNPKTFIARVVTITDILCKIIPQTEKSEPEKSQKEEKKESMKVVLGGEEELISSVVNDGGMISEWIPRNTLRFRRYIKRSQLKSQSLKFSFVPSSSPP